MRAAVVAQHGPPESVVVEDLDDLRPAPGQVVVDVRAAAVNFPDVLIAADQYQITVPTPFTPGSEFAGIVSAVGADVSGVAVGDAVSGASMVGAFAEQVCVPVGSVTAVPEGVTFEDAAAFGVVYATAYHALRSIAEVQPGDWVVVLGAAGGVGLAAVDIAQQLGGRVVAAASGADKLAVCRERGAEHVIDYEAEDLKDRIKSLTGGGAQVVIDPVGGRYSEAALRATSWGSRFVVVGFASGEIPRIPLNLVLLKGVIVRGFEIRTFPEVAPERNARDRRELAELFASGQLRPYVSRVFPLDDIGLALRHVADRQAVGKVIISCT